MKNTSKDAKNASKKYIRFHTGKTQNQRFSLLCLPPAEGGGMEIKMKKSKKKQWLQYVIFVLLCVALLVGYMVYQKQQKDKELQEALKNAVTCVDDLDGKRIGVQIGTTGDIYASDYEGDEAGTVIERYNKGTDAIQALKNGKIDCVILDEQPSLAYTEKNVELKILKEEFALEDYAICIDKSNSELKEDINNALVALKEDGTLEQIIDNYVGTDDVKGTYSYEKKDVDRSNGTLVVATNASFKPYEYYENGEIVGLDMDMMQAICDELGMELQIEDMEFDSIISAVVSGKADVGTAGMTVTEDRLKNVDFTDTYTTAKQVIIVKDPEVAAKADSFRERFKDNFIKDSRYRYIVKGFKNTLLITVFSVLIGIMLGGVIAIIRTSHDRNGSFGLLNLICRIYLTIMRGTPAVVQLLIFYYVILVSVDAKIVVAVIAFGLNSAAYVAEVVRSGIMSVDVGQFEAGRSLGLNYRQTMTAIIIPQAFKNILPALCNEFISLLKETSISGYIALVDLTKAGDIIRSNTYDAFMPLIAVALIYLVIVMVLTAGVNVLERRMRGNER